MKKIVLLGDSSLDNVHWVNKDGRTQESVPEQLSLRLPEHKVINFAVDGFTTQDVLKGARRNKAVSSPFHKDEMDYPLEKLKEEKELTHVVVSVGGNNVREQLARLESNTSNRKGALVGILRNIQEELIQILEEIKTSQPGAHRIIMLQYTPDSKNDNYRIYSLMKLLYPNTNPVKTLHDLIQQIYQPILQYAKEHKIPVVDTASSLCHKDSSLYVSQIEPSAKGGAIIADLIAHVVQHHDFKNEAQIYLRPFTDSSDIQTHKGFTDWYPTCLTSKFDELSTKIDAAITKNDSIKLNEAPISLSEKQLFLMKIATITVKATQLRKDGHIAAANEGVKLYKYLEGQGSDFFENSISEGDFKHWSLAAIEEARKILDTHRGWSEFLGNLACFVLGFGVGLIVKGIYNYYHEKPFFFVCQTKSSKILDEIEQTVRGASLGTDLLS